MRIGFEANFKTANGGKIRIGVTHMRLKDLPAFLALVDDYAAITEEEPEVQVGFRSGFTEAKGEMIANSVSSCPDGVFKAWRAR